MQIILRLSPVSPILLEFSYYPKLAAAIYKVISHSDPEFANDLHSGEAYRSRIKLFGFSPLYSRQTEVYPEDRCQNKSGGLVFKGACTITICSPLPEFMSRLEQGLMKKSELFIGSQLIRVQGITPVAAPSFGNKMTWSLLQPASCVTSWSNRKEQGKKYVLPGTPVEGQSCSLLLYFLYLLYFLNPSFPP